MKTKLFILAVILTFNCAPTWAQDTSASPKTAILAEELLTLFQVDKAMDATFQQVMKMQEQMATSKTSSPEQKEKQRLSMQATLDETKKLFSWETIKPTFIQIYSEVFTEEELQGMIDFFKSPVGQKWIAKQPQLQAATMQKMQAIMMEAQPKLQEAIKKAQESDTKTKSE
jgi:hypothetical protein